MPTAIVTAKGKVTLPAEVRESLGLTEGSVVGFVRSPGGYLMVPGSRAVTRLAGFFGEFEGAPATARQMYDGISEEMGQQP